ncbi:MAG: hypothetical protein IJ083_11920 [Clostridia bacterium]|nr:hypothetical protein [Clostridia bacterium]
MIKRILSVLFISLSLTLLCAMASATTIRGSDTVDLQVGLPLQRPSTAGYFSHGAQFELSDSPNFNDSLIWSVTSTSPNAPHLQMTTEGIGASMIARLNLDPSETYTIGQSYEYTIQADWNGNVITTPVTVNYVGQTLPGSFSISVTPVTLTSSQATLGTPVQISNCEMFMKTGETYRVRVEVDVLNTGMQYMTNYRMWSNTEWEEVPTWSDQRLSSYEDFGGPNTGVYTAQKTGTYEHVYIVSFSNANGHASNLGYYIPYKLYVTDAQGNIPVPSSNAQIIGSETVDFQLGLPLSRPIAGGFFSCGSEFYYSEALNPSDTLIWTVSADTQGAPSLMITPNALSGPGTGSARLNLDPSISYTNGGPYVYTIQTDLNGVTTTTSVTAYFTGLNLPGSYGMSVTPITLTPSQATLGTPVSVSGGNMSMQTNETYRVQVEVDVSNSGLQYMTNERMWTDTEWDEIPVWDDSRFSSPDFNGPNTGVYTAKQPGTYDHYFIVSFDAGPSRGSNLGCYIPYTLTVTDPSGNVPALVPELFGTYSWAKQGSPSVTVDVYQDLSLTPDATLWNSSDFISIGITNRAALAAQYGGTPTWTVTASDPDLDFSYYGDEFGCFGQLSSIPQKKNSTITVECTWGGQPSSYTINLNVTNLPSALPTGLGNLPDVIRTKVGDVITIDPTPDPASFSLPGYAKQYYVNIFDYASRDWSSSIPTYTMAQAGVHSELIGLQYGSLMITKPVTIVVTENDGTISSADYVPFGQVTILPSNLKTIESEAFAGTSLTEVDIPSGVSIADDAFDGTGLIAVYAHDQNTIDYALNHDLIPVVDP